MKKLLILSFCLTLAACSSTSDSDGDTTAKRTNKKSAEFCERKTSSRLKQRC